MANTLTCDQAVGGILGVPSIKRPRPLGHSEPSHRHVVGCGVPPAALPWLLPIKAWGLASIYFLFTQTSQASTVGCRRQTVKFAIYVSSRAAITNIKKRI